MAIKIEIADSEARRLLEEWEQRRMQLEGELTDVSNAIHAVKAQLSAKLPAAVKNAIRDKIDKDFDREFLRPKKKKGENLRAVQGYLAPMNGQGATASEISTRLGVGVSSVQLVLNRHSDVFEKGTDGLWRVKVKK